MLDIHSDPLREVRVIRRWALLAVLVAVSGLLWAYRLLLGLSLLKLGLVVTPAAFAVLVAMEFASRWEYRMRRRHAYPYRLGYELASVHHFRQACQRIADLVGKWLRARAVVVAWLDEDGHTLAPVAAYGLPAGWTETAPHISPPESSFREALRQGSFLAKSSASGDPWFGGHYDRSRVVYVPLLSRDRPEGVLAVAADHGNAEARDQRLLAALGMVTSLALDNCRLYEGERAHAHHLQQVSRMKSDFLATISHELRTPLTSIKMAGEMLLEEEEARDPNSPRVRLVRNIVKGATRLTSLIADLVDVSREDEFQPRLELDPVPLSDIVATAAAVIQPLIAAKRQVLEIQPAPEEAIVLVDRLRFEQVIINLLSNAQRYSPAGGHILVNSRLQRSEVIISVTDSGPGVALQDQELIFEPFYRSDRSGLGLGLAIAKSLVELHNGRIWVENVEGQGSSFCVALPRHNPAAGRLLASGARRQ